MTTFNLEDCDRSELQATLTRLRLAEKLQQRAKLDFFQPYPKQMEFYRLGATKRERVIMAGNQLGKTECGAVEMAFHLTGLYPKWWPGRRFTKPIMAWACGESAAKVRDVQQSKLCGHHTIAQLPSDEGWGTGFIPRHLLLGRTLGHGTTGAFDTITVRHASGGISVLGFKSYVQGRALFQADSLDLVWEDEEPPGDVHSECKARITATGGMLYMTFTPLNGITEIVSDFYPAPNSTSRGFVLMGMRDVTHIPNPEEVAAGYKPFEREARVNGIPLLGSGAVWEEVSPDMIRVPPIPLSEIPPFWKKIAGVDFGIGHPFACATLCHDADADIVYVVHEHKVADAMSALHVAALRPVLGEIPVAWPHDGGDREKSTGIQLVESYRDLPGSPGLRMRPTHATHPRGGYSTEAGIDAILIRMRTGRFKVFSTLVNWWLEFGSYHRKDGLIVKKNDDLMSATRQGIMDLRYARPVLFGRPPALKKPGPPQQLDPWTDRPVKLGY